ncbi:amidohydrolase family protein [Amycolatopsis benzoatilytica]|uniref:amidohydrolase family protein n=1 Tax=Amycolatopsis benzoatilytica TaxID=346045 RepID=UPI00037C6685|nr:amidohydrolase family protein [Amycolatopsis benzoatilytica]
MKTIAIEEHWTTPAIDHLLRTATDDPSIALNDRADLPDRLLDIGDQRISWMDSAGIDRQILSVAPPGTHGFPAAQAIALSREANDLVSAAVEKHPSRFRAMTLLPMSDPDAAVAELERTADDPAHVGIMSYGRSGDRPLDDPAYDDLLGTAAALGRPVFVHPQIPTGAVRKASYSGFSPDIDLALATYGLGWHYEAGLAVIRLILRGTFDRHPALQVVLGHWGEVVLFALDRIDSLGHAAAHLQRRVSEYFRTNIHLATSGMLVPRLLRTALEYTTADRILLSGDYPFHQLDAAAITEFLRELPDPADREKIAHGNAAALYRIAG